MVLGCPDQISMPLLEVIQAKLLAKHLFLPSTAVL
jgi:hypothetical protein